MKAELKIGNLVNFNDTIATVLELRENHARIEYMRSDTGMRYSTLVEYDRLEGVPITAEWLVKFGADQAMEEFRFKELNTELKDNKFNLCIIYDEDDDKSCVILEESYGHDESESAFIPVFIRYVHQLQNLYFALTGQELTPSNHEPQS